MIMATHAIGKLKFNLSDQGLAFRWGDGEVHRLFQGKKKAEDDEYVENTPLDGEEGDPADFDAPEDDYGDDYDDADYDDDPKYDDYDDAGTDDGRYADDYGDDRDYDQDDYADDPGYADDYEDGDDYDDGYADDQYDDGYADDDYDDGQDYDDRYSDEDAGEGYDDGEYAGQGGLMGYVDEHDWVTYLLLFAFPPLGIWLLWRRNRFDKPVRWAITIASALWFVAALFLLLHGLFGGAGDKQAQPTITIPTLAPTTAATATIAPEASPETDATGDAADTGANAGADTTSKLDDLLNAEVSPSPTPLTGSVGGTGDSAAVGNYVYSPATGLYYHNVDDCPSIPEGVSVSRVSLDIAQNSRHQSACPDCIGGGTATKYYGTSGGKYYHLDPNCSKMQNARVYTKEAAESEGKTACPVCVTKKQESLDEDDAKGLAFLKSSTSDKSGISVYSTNGGKYFHVKSDCSGMEGARKGTLKSALLAGKTACPKCCSAAGTPVYCTEKGTSYHVDPKCQGMSGAKRVSLAEAMVLGKSKCKVCIKGSITELAEAAAKEASSSGSDSKSKSTSGSDSSSKFDTTHTKGNVLVYATKDGHYYHTNSTCSGMKNAQQVTLKSMLLAKRKACPVCAGSAKTKVYATSGGKYYHSYATCSDMKNATEGTLAEALAAGYKRCPKCWNATSSDKGSTSSAALTGVTAKKAEAAATTGPDAAKGTATVESAKVSAAKSTATASNTYVYATIDGSYYHLKSNCSGMTDASRVTLNTAVKAGKKPCPTCASAANRTVYSAKDGKHYHAAAVCEPSGLKKGTKRTLAEALMLNQTACPYCMTGSAAAETPVRSTSTFKSGTSGIRVYATLAGKYYHTNRTCGGQTNASRVTLETALNYGKKPCPVCASSASRAVYATPGGKYYHYSKSDAGSGAKRGTLAAALAYGFDPCPYCVAHTAPSSVKETYKSGTSGIKVYASLNSTYYHSEADCSGLTDARRVTLETALNYGKKACPVCLAAANRKVYAKPGEKYYHYSKAHAGSGATAGTLASAKAYGLKACPACTVGSVGTHGPGNGGSEDAPVSTLEYGAAAESDVYIDVTSANNYYHKGGSCSKAEFSGGTKVTLQYARDWGYKACPYCNPPTYVILETAEQ